MYVYIKCISHEGSPWPLECQRAQLPIKQEFDKIKNNSIPFIFLGYDQDNNVYVCWNPSNVKPRLNQKSSVSFHSRLSFQQNVKEGCIEEKYLTNGDKIVLFKRNDIIRFFKNIGTYFEGIDTTMGKENRIVLKSNHKLLNLKDDLEVWNNVSNSPITSILGLTKDCAEKYQTRYNEMSFSDWYSLVESFLDNKVIPSSILNKQYKTQFSDTISNSNVGESSISDEFSNKELNDIILEYKKLFLNITTSNRKGKKSPHKYILLLSVISMIEDGKIHDNKIFLDTTLINYFKSQWEKYVIDNDVFKENITMPYWHMQNEPFWHLLDLDGNSLHNMKVTYSLSFLKSYTYVKLSYQLYQILQYKNVRMNLIEYIIKLL